MRRFTGVAPFSLDLHVLSAPLTFVLSQDQTLQLNPVCSGPAKEPAALTPAKRLDSDKGEERSSGRDVWGSSRPTEVGRVPRIPVSVSRMPGRAHVTSVRTYTIQFSRTEPDCEKACSLATFRVLSDSWPCQTSAEPRLVEGGNLRLSPLIRQPIFSVHHSTAF